MPSLTFIFRVRDNLPLVEAVDEENKDHREQDIYKRQAKDLAQRLRTTADSMHSFESGSQTFQYAWNGAVVV